MKSVSFLFGAGAEISYGLPSGGRFALEIFRQDSSQAKQSFKDNRSKIDKTRTYAGSWLPSDFDNKNVSSYGKSVYESIMKDTIGHNRSRIIEKINSFDDIALAELEKLKERAKNLTLFIEKIIEREISECNMGSNLSFSEYIDKGNLLFQSNWFSAFLLMYQQKEKLNALAIRELQIVLVSIIQLHLGALSDDFARHFNDNIFKKKDDNIDFLDDIGDIFRLNYQSVGLTGLNFIMEPVEHPGGDEEGLFLNFIRNILENIYSSVLDYKSLIDSNWHYLYCPKEEWAKFCKISIFLLTVQSYIKKQFDDNFDENKTGYYHDVCSIKGKIEIKSIATTNYNTLVEKIIGMPVCHLNGSTDMFYDPYLNRIVTQDNSADDVHFIVPLIFTQSGTKPMTSIEMSQKYVEMYKNFKDSECVVIVGFGFNSDDEHINGILRTLIDIDDKRIMVIDTNPLLNNSTIAKKLKIKKSSNVDLLIVNQQRKHEEKSWVDFIVG